MTHLGGPVDNLPPWINNSNTAIEFETSTRQKWVARQRTVEVNVAWTSLQVPRQFAVLRKVFAE